MIGTLPIPMLILDDIVTLILTQKEFTPIECYLTFEGDISSYKIIDRHQIFSLKPKLRGFPSNGEFQCDRVPQLL
jgi:hypothetical protein